MGKNGKSHTGLKIFLGIFIPLFIIVILPITLIFSLFYDSSFNNEKYPTNYVLEEKINNVFYNSVENTKNDGLVNINASEYALNGLLHSVIYSSNLVDENNKIISNYYIDIYEQNITLTVDINLSFFKTKAKIIVEPKLYKNSDFTKEYFSLKIKDIKLGRLGGIKNLIKQFLNNVDNNYIEQSFKDSGLTVHSNLEDFEIKYYIVDLVNDINKMLNSDGKQSLINSLLNFSFSNDLFDFNINENNNLSLNLKLNDLDENENFQTRDKETNINLEPYINKLETVIENQIINYDYCDTFFSYLIYGYDYLSSEDQAIIYPLDLSIIEIENNSSYKGIEYEDKKDINDIIINNFDLSNPNESILTINEDEFNGYLKTQNLIGYNYLLSKETSSSYTFNYFAIDDFYINFVDNKMYLTIGFSVNGFDTSIFMDFTNKNEVDNKLVLKLNEVRYGNILANEEIVSLLFEILSNNFKDEHGVLTIDKTNKEIAIDIAYIFPQTIKDQIELLGGDISCSIIGSSLDDNGYINIKLK